MLHSKLCLNYYVTIVVLTWCFWLSWALLHSEHMSTTWPWAHEHYSTLSTGNRALLNSESDSLFITKQIAQQLHLPRNHSVVVACLGEDTPQIRPKGLVTLRITGNNQAGKVHSINALVPSRITSNTCIPEWYLIFQDNQHKIGKVSRLAPRQYQKL